MVQLINDLNSLSAEMSTSAHYCSRGEKPKQEHFWIVLLGAGVIKCQQERLDLLCNKIHVHVSASAAGKNELENISCQQNGLSLMFGSGAGAAERFSGSSHGPVTCYCWAALASAKVWMRAWTVVCARVSPWVAGCRSPFFARWRLGSTPTPSEETWGLLMDGWMGGYWTVGCTKTSYIETHMSVAFFPILSAVYWKDGSITAFREKQD